MGQSVDVTALRRLLLAVVLVSGAAGLLAEIGYFHLGLAPDVASFFSLSGEANLPTWVASSLLFACSLLLGSIAHDLGTGPFRVHWWGLAVGFAYMSLDEAVELHEHLHALVDGSGVLYFSWVIPAAAIVLVLGLLYIPFLRHLQPIARRRFIIAGAMYVGGALLMELPLGWWTEQHGDDNLGYALMDWVEEMLELSGVSFFLMSLWIYRSDPS